MVKKYTKKIKENKSFFRTKRKPGTRRKLCKKQKGGANCPKEGFRQHLGECWNDSMMMVLCYSNGIGDRIQAFFDGITQIQARYKKQNPYLNSDFLIKDCIKKYIALPRHKEEYKHLLPLNLDFYNSEHYKTFEENAIAYIQKMYTRYQNKKEHPLDSPPPIAPDVKNPKPHQKNLKKIKSYNSSISCVKANYDVYNINKISKRDYSFEKHGGTISNSIITLCMVNYFLINLQLPPKEEAYPRNFEDIVINEAEDRKFIDLNYVELLPYTYIVFIKRKLYEYMKMKNSTPAEKKLQTEKFSKTLEILINIPLFIDKYKKTIELLSKFTSLLISISYETDKVEDLVDGGHAVSFFKCNDKLNYFNDNFDLVRSDNLNIAETYHNEIVDQLKQKIKFNDEYNKLKEEKKNKLKTLMDEKKRKAESELQTFIFLNNKTKAIFSKIDGNHILTEISGLELKEFSNFPFYYNLLEPFCLEYDNTVIVKNLLRHIHSFFRAEMFEDNKSVPPTEDIIKWGDLFISLRLYIAENQTQLEEILKLINPYIEMINIIGTNKFILNYMESKKEVYPLLFPEEKPVSYMDVVLPDTDEEEDSASAEKVPSAPLASAPLALASAAKRSASASGVKTKSKSKSNSKSKSKSKSKNSS